nr:hypothetical protein [Tanacetum cinerariifolium]
MRDSLDKYFFRLEMWKVLWTLLSSSRSSSLYATGPIRSRILNGSMYRVLTDESTRKPTSKPKPTKKKAPIKTDRRKGLNVLLEVALSEVTQLKEATKQSKKDFHISQASGSGEGTNFQSGVLNEQQCDSEEKDDDNEDDEGNDGDDDNDGDNNDDIDGDDDDDNDGDNGDDNDEDDKEKKEESDGGEELYKDVNVNLRKEDVEMTDADQGGADQHNVSQESRFNQEEEDAHVTLTTVHDTQKTKADNEIASLIDTAVHTKELSGQTSTFFTVPITVIPTTIPPP